MEGKCKIARQVAKAGYFAEVTIDLEQIPGNEMLFDMESIESLPKNSPYFYYHTAFWFGAAHIQGILGYSKGWNIKILSVRESPVDTTPMVVLAAFVGAIIDAATKLGVYKPGFKNRMPEINDEGRVVF